MPTTLTLPMWGLIGGAVLVLAVLAALAMRPSAGRKVFRRLKAIKLRHSDRADDRVEAQYRRAIAARRPRSYRVAGSQSRGEALKLRLDRAGQGWTITQYIIVSIVLIVIVTALVWLKSGIAWLALSTGVVIGAGLPHLMLNVMIGRRTKAFVARFPDALELLVRGLRSGLPITETIGVVATELPGPVAEEFKLVNDRVRLGRTLDESLQETADRLNLSDFSFFCISLAIQRETGGNLAETLSNLADVLRKRAQMKLKISALSSEAKASAYIIGALPFLLFLALNAINPEYMGKFFTDQRATGALIGAGVWLGIGAFIMAQMINFEI